MNIHNYKKANWTAFTEEIENTLQNNTHKSPTSYLGNQILTNAILNADKHHIPKGLKHKQLPLPEDIRIKIRTRDQLRQQNPKDIQIKSLNNEIDKQITQYKTDIWKQKTRRGLGPQA